GRDDGVGQEGHEAEGEGEHAAGHRRREGVQPAVELGAVAAGDVAQAGGEVAGLLGDADAVDQQARKKAGAQQRVRETFAFEHAVGGRVEAFLERVVGHGALGQAQRVGGGDAVFQQHREGLAKVEHGGAGDQAVDDGDAQQQRVEREPAGGGLAPTEDRHEGDDRADEDERAVVEHGFGDDDQQARGGRHVAAERVEQGLQAGQQEEEKEENDAAGQQADEGGIDHRGDELAAHFLHFAKVEDEAFENFAEVAGGLAGGDEVDGLRIEDPGVGRDGGGEAVAFAEAAPDAGEERALPRVLQAQGEQADGLAGGHGAADEVGEGFEKGQAFGAGGRGLGIGTGVEGGRRRVGGGRAFAGVGAGGFFRGGAVFLDAHGLEAAGLEASDGVAAGGRVERAVGDAAGG